jgi:hypothetical protein
VSMEAEMKKKIKEMETEMKRTKFHSASNPVQSTTLRVADVLLFERCRKLFGESPSSDSSTRESSTSKKSSQNIPQVDSSSSDDDEARHEILNVRNSRRQTRELN